MKNDPRHHAAAVRCRLTIAEHNAVLRAAVEADTSLSDIIRRCITLQLLEDRETGNAAAQPVSGPPAR